MAWIWGVRWAGFAAGLCLLAVTWSSVVKTLLVPRDMRSLINNAVSRWVILGYRSAARNADLERRERILAVGPPVFLATLLAVWIGGLYFGYALVMLPLAGTPAAGSPAAALRLAGSSLFTLGFATPQGPAGYAIVFTAAVSGIAVSALMIGYMPTIYGAYSRRETPVTMLEVLAGAPPWGPELLSRSQLFGNVGYLPRLYDRWAEWAADITESHTTYRTLIYFRSRSARTSWALALLAVLDAAALHLALFPRSAPPEARIVLRVGFTAMRAVAATLGVPVNEDPRPSDPLFLTRGEFDDALAKVTSAGWTPERPPDEAWPHFRGWRVNYETAAYNIAAHLHLPPAPWSGPRSYLGAPSAFPEPVVNREPGQAG